MIQQVQTVGVNIISGVLNIMTGVYKNFTDKYKNSPKNKNYVKYIVYPPFTGEEIDEMKEKGKKGEPNSFYGKY